LDRKILEEIAKEETNRKLELDRKREEFRQQQLEIKKANDEKIKQKLDDKAKEKLVDKKLIEDYTNMLERQEIQNRMRRTLRSNKPVPEDYYIRGIEDERARELEMERKYLQELEHIEQR
jgi:membrane-bound lytic murein transglycosylase B